MNLRMRRRREKYAVIELRQEKTRAMLLGVDEDKKLIPEKIYEEITPREMNRLTRPRRGKRTVILAVDPSLALTITVPLKLYRETNLMKQPVGRIELENLLAQTMTKFFRDHRGQASYHLHVEENDAILVSNRIYNFKIDGHRIVNPLGFEGRTIEAIMDITFTTRQIFEEWRDFFSTPDRFYFTETAQAELVVMHRAHPLPVQLFVVEPKSSALFVMSKSLAGITLDRSQVAWGTNDLLDGIDEVWGLGRGVAEGVYKQYVNDGTTSAVSRLFEKKFKESLAQLHKDLVRAKAKGKIYVESVLPLPVKLPHRMGKVTLVEIEVKDLFKKFGFHIEPKEWPFSYNEIFPRVAPFLEFYYDKSDSPVNYWLRRRLHWLSE